MCIYKHWNALQTKANENMIKKKYFLHHYLHIFGQRNKVILTNLLQIFLFFFFILKVEKWFPSS